jgi:hypothetical protein
VEDVPLHVEDVPLHVGSASSIPSGPSSVRSKFQLTSRYLNVISARLADVSVQARRFILEVQVHVGSVGSMSPVGSLGPSSVRSKFQLTDRCLNVCN